MPDEEVERALAELASAGVTLWCEGQTLRYRAPAGFMTPQRIASFHKLRYRIIDHLQASRIPQIEALCPRLSTVPLTVRQFAYWRLLSEDGTRQPWNTFTTIRLRGSLDFENVRRSLHALIERHEALRTRIVGEDTGLVQVIDPPDSNVATLELLHEAGTWPTEPDARAVLGSFIHRPLRAQGERLFRAGLLSLSTEDHVLTLVLDHIMSDARSISILRTEFLNGYFALERGQLPQLPGPRLQFADYAIWEQRSLEAILRTHLPYWLQALAGAPALMLPKDGPSTGSCNTYSSTGEFQFCDEQETSALRSLAIEAHSTMAAVVLAGCFAVLWHWSGQYDLVIRSTASLRLTPALADTVGFFLNHVVLRIHIERDLTFTGLLDRVTRALLDAQHHSVVPLDSVLAATGEDGPARSARAFSFNFVPDDMAGPRGVPTAPAPIALETFGIPDLPETSFVEMVLAVYGGQTRLVGKIHYSCDAFRHASIARFVGNFVRFFPQVLVDRSIHLSQLRFVPGP